MRGVMRGCDERGDERVCVCFSTPRTRVCMALSGRLFVGAW